MRRETHTNLVLEESGLCISTQYPFLGASPDSLVICDCCDKGCVEVKCPYRCFDKSIEEALTDNDFCLERSSSGTLQLKRRHQYYYQVQCQCSDGCHLSRRTAAIQALRRSVPTGGNLYHLMELPETQRSAQPTAEQLLTMVLCATQSSTVIEVT